MKYVIFIIALFQFASLYAQKTMPGGVKGVAVWEITEVTQTGHAKWQSNLYGNPDSTLVIKGNKKTINNNPALVFDAEANPVNNTLNPGSLASFSMFTVCQGIDTLMERVILSIVNDTAAEMVMTNRRMATLDFYRYANYNTNLQLYPKIYSYIQNKPKDQGTITRRLQLGRPPQNQQLPVSFFNGIIPEVILFDRVLSPAERQKVESYLALKYGISLNQELPRSFLNSNGEIIWDAEKNEAFNQNIAGAGRDDLSGLNQSVSESILTPGVMKLSVNGKLQNNSFLVWGDNGRPLRFDGESGIRKLQREWKISAFDFKAGAVSLETNELSLNEINPLREGEIYWLVTDRSGTGKYPFGNTEYTGCMPSALSDGSIRFGSVIIDPDNSGDDVFTLLTAPPFFTRNIVQLPSCLQPQSGMILCEIAGGKPPFDLNLKGISNNRFQVSAREAGRNHIFGNISQGAYFLQVSDADNKQFTEKIWVSNTHNWESCISRSYDLVKGESLVLDPSEGMSGTDYIYSWTTPDGSVLYQEKLSVDQPGIYLLSVTDKNNCNSIHEINVREKGRSVFQGVEMFPNPAEGWFVIRISLDRRENINVVISDVSGVILKQTLLQNDYFYLYNEIIKQPGIYFITLVSSNEKESLKLIVE